jgi:uncharacterized protein
MVALAPVEMEGTGMNYFLLSGLSFIVGIIVGLTGIGGASLITPMLILGFQVPASIAVSSDVVAATLMKIVGGIRHWKQQTIDYAAVKWLACGSVPGSLLGIAALHWMQDQWIDLDSLLLRLLGIVILFITGISLIQLLLLIFAPQWQFPALPKVNLASWSGRGWAIAIGAVLGGMVGMTSVSSGSMFALALIAFFQLDARKLVGTDLAQAAILLSFTAIGHLSLGTVHWNLVLPIWLGSVPGVLLGSKLCQIAPQQLLRFVIYFILVAVSWKLVYAV